MRFHNSRIPISEGIQFRESEWRWGKRTYVMGIVNVTPDSFSGDGLADSDSAFAHAWDQINAGADIIDIGGESTRPGHHPVAEIDELARVLPVIRRLRQSTAVPISIDTTKIEVLKQAIDAGADILNCVNGMPDDLLAAAAAHQVPIVITHWHKSGAQHDNIVAEVLSTLKSLAQRALEHGIPRQHIILDPGIGFGKTAEDNICILSELKALPQLGFPTMIGTSRKSFIGKLTGREANQRQFGTAASISMAIAAGIDIIRVHDVAEMRQCAQVCDAVIRGWRPDNWQ